VDVAFVDTLFDDSDNSLRGTLWNGKSCAEAVLAMALCFLLTLSSELYAGREIDDNRTK